jgi:hypothetical protein
MKLDKRNILLEGRQPAFIREEDEWMKDMLIPMGFDPLYGEEPDGIPYPDSEDPVKWWDWSRRTLVRRWLMKEDLSDAGGIYKTWYLLKFICQELDNTWARRYGRYLADMREGKDLVDGNDFKAEIGKVLKKSSDFARIDGSLWKHYSHFRKWTGVSIEKISLPGTERSSARLVEELKIMEDKALEHGIFFGTTPVIVRIKE